jgi:hypothetical protein
MFDGPDFVTRLTKGTFKVRLKHATDFDWELLEATYTGEVINYPPRNPTTKKARNWSCKYMKELGASNKQRSQQKN